MNLLILSLYFIGLFVIGWTVMKKWFGGFPLVFTVAGAFIIGMAIGVPVTYLLTILFSKTSFPLLWGVIATIGISFVCGRRIFTTSTHRNLRVGDIALAVIVIIFSTWVMTKTFHGNSAGELFVGSNNVFDSAFSLGIIRSVSWGSNIPIMSPFESEAPFFYHYYFPFLVATMEYFGIPIALAVNIPSIASFAALLIIVYFIPQLLAKQKTLAGWLTFILTITNSSLTFLYVIGKKDIWHLPTYPFAGPFDGSVISLFVTLNSFVNQRHLAFSIALGLLLYILTWKLLQEKKIRQAPMIVIGAASGLLLLWNIALYPVVMVLLVILMISTGRWKQLMVYLVVSFTTALIINIPNWSNLATALIYLGGEAAVVTGTVQHSPTWNIGQYLWQNLGILPPVAALGFVTLSGRVRSSIAPFAILFIGECVLAGIGHRGFDQKFYSFLIIGINALAATGIVWLWKKRPWILRIAALVIFGAVTISGVIDLMPIKNEFAFPLIGKRIQSVISWIHSETPKDAVFVSYADMIDPVVFAGRKNYFGFFGNIGWKYRTEEVKRIYDGDSGFARSEGISYILIPRVQKNDFPYTVNRSKLETAFPTVYTDADFLIVKVN